jgi:Zn-finger nucleic acid-binding protein
MTETYFNCPRCRLTITPKAQRLTVDHCPRCLAQRGAVVRMFASTLPAHELYAVDARLG